MLSNKLSSLVSPETPTVLALSSLSAPSPQRPRLSCPRWCWSCGRTRLFSSWLGACGFVHGDWKGVCPVAVKQSHIWHWNATVFRSEAIQRPFAAKVLRRHLDSQSPLTNLTWAARTESFLSTVGHITRGRFHLFQYLVDDKSDSWELSDGGSWAGF